MLRLSRWLVVIAAMLTACCEQPVAGLEAGQMSATATPVRAERGNPEIESELQAIVDADPVQAAKQALANGDKRFWAYHNRVERIIPGVSDQAVIEQAEIRVPHGMGDVVYGPKHLQLRQQFIDYAKQYNSVVLLSIKTNNTQERQ